MHSYHIPHGYTSDTNNIYSWYEHVLACRLHVWHIYTYTYTKHEQHTRHITHTPFLPIHTMNHTHIHSSFVHQKQIRKFEAEICFQCQKVHSTHLLLRSLLTILSWYPLHLIALTQFHKRIKWLNGVSSQRQVYFSIPRCSNNSDCCLKDYTNTSSTIQNRTYFSI